MTQQAQTKRQRYVTGCGTRVARTTVLESGCEYVVPGTAHLRHAADEDLILSPTKGFIEKQHVLVAHIIVQAQRSTNVPIRVFNPGALPVTLKRGAVAGILQPATVLGKLEPQPPLPYRPLDLLTLSASLPSHLQALYNESSASLPKGDHERVAHLLRSYSDVFSTGPTDLGRTGLVQHDILTTPGPPVKQQPRCKRQTNCSRPAGAAEPGHWCGPTQQQQLGCTNCYGVLTRRTRLRGYASTTGP